MSEFTNPKLLALALMLAGMTSAEPKPKGDKK